MYSVLRRRWYFLKPFRNNQPPLLSKMLTDLLVEGMLTVGGAIPEAALMTKIGKAYNAILMNVICRNHKKGLQRRLLTKRVYAITLIRKKYTRGSVPFVSK